MAEVRGFRAEDVPAMTEIWNRVVRDGEAFPQTEEMTEVAPPDENIFVSIKNWFNSILDYLGFGQ